MIKIIQLARGRSGSTTRRGTADTVEGKIQSLQRQIDTIVQPQLDTVEEQQATNQAQAVSMIDEAMRILREQAIKIEDLETRVSALEGN